MKVIKNKNNGIIINGNGINSSQNTIIWSIIIPLTDIEYAITAFPYINGVARLDGGNFLYGDNKHIPNLVEILSSNYVEVTDVGLSGTELTKNFSTVILFMTNALELNMDEWELVNE